MNPCFRKNFMETSEFIEKFQYVKCWTSEWEIADSNGASISENENSVFTIFIRLIWKNISIFTEIVLWNMNFEMNSYNKYYERNRWIENNKKKLFR